MEKASRREKDKLNITKILIFCMLFGTFIWIPISIGPFSGAISCTDLILIIWVIYGMTGNFTYEKSKQKDILQIMYIILIFIYVLICMLSNIDRLSNIILTARCIFLPYLIFIFGKRNNSKLDFVYFARILSIYNIIISTITIYNYLFQYEQGANLSILRNSSSNYTSSIILCIVPLLVFVLKQIISINKIDKFIISVSIFWGVLSIFLSGSRMAFGLSILILIFYILSTKKKIKNIIIISLLLITIFTISFKFIQSVNPDILYRVDRYLSMFGNSNQVRNDIGSSDTLRFYLWETAINQIKEKPLIGHGTSFLNIINGNIPVHNFILELLVSFGIIGLFVYIASYASILILLFKKMINKRINIMMILCMIVMVYGMCLFHPFITTGVELNVVLGLSIYSVYNYINCY